MNTQPGGVTSTPQVIYVQAPPQEMKHSGLGIAALVLALVAFPFALIPFFGMMAYPLTGLAFILAAIAMGIAMFDKHTKEVFPGLAIMMCIVNVIAPWGTALLLGITAAGVAANQPKAQKQRAVTAVTVKDEDAAETAAERALAQEKFQEARLNAQKIAVEQRWEASKKFADEMDKYNQLVLDRTRERIENPNAPQKPLPPPPTQPQD